MPRLCPSDNGAAVLVLMAAILVLGLARVAMLPPFEGFDETGHYSYVGQIATTGTWPRRGDPMAAEIDRYIAVAPIVPAMKGRWTYADFAAAPERDRAAARAVIHAPEAASPWAPGTIGNWEAQHPPLYYALMAPAYRWAAGWSLAARLLLLRSLSYVMAWSGLCLAVYAARTATGPTDRPAVAAAATVLWPVLLPEWFPEMARVGNDSLLVPLAGLTWLALRRALADGGLGSALLLGTVIGLGLLTKATFLPLAAAAGLLLAAEAVAGRRARRRLAGVLLCGVAILAVAGWWYLGQAMVTGDPIGANDSINLAREGGLWSGLRRHAAIGTLLRMVGTFDLSLVWDSSWSFVIPSLVAIAPMMVLVPALVAAGLWSRWGTLSWLGGLSRSSSVDQRRPAPVQHPEKQDGVDGSTPSCLAPLTLALFVVALVYYSLVLIAAGGSGQPAWYLHAFLPVLWPLMAWGFAAALRRPWQKAVLLAVVVYGALFLLAVTLSDATLFAGCAVPVHDGRHFEAAQVIGCLANPARLAAGLDMLAYPGLAAGLFAIGAPALVVGVVILLRGLTARPDRGPAAWSVSPASR